MLIPQSYPLFAIDLSKLPPETDERTRAELIEVARASADRVIAWYIPDKDPFAPVQPVCVVSGMLEDYAVGEDQGRLAVVVTDSRKDRDRKKPKDDIASDREGSSRGKDDRQA